MSYLSSKFFRFAFGVSGDKVAVPDDLDPSGYVSYEEGFPPDYELPKTDPSRKPVPRDETNQIYYDMSSAIQQYQKYSIPEFITAADNDGVAFSYSLGVRVMYTADAGATWNIYRSISAANTALPTDATKWVLDNEYPVASETVSGIQENATQAETNAGSADNKTVTPLKLATYLATVKESIAAQTLTDTTAATYTFSHALGAVPNIATFKLKCLIADLGFSVNDEVIIAPATDGNGAASYGFTPQISSTNVVVRTGDSGVVLTHKTTFVATAITPSSWEMSVYVAL